MAWGTHRGKCPKDRSLILQLLPVASTAAQNPRTADASTAEEESLSARLLENLSAARRSGPINKRVIRAVRKQASEILARAIEQYVNEPTTENLATLLQFPSQSFRVEGGNRSKRQETLTTRLRLQLRDFESGIRQPPVSTAKRTQTQSATDPDQLRRVLETFLSECNVRGAVARLSSEESVLKIGAEVLDVLKTKHPDAPLDTQLHSPPDLNHPTAAVATREEVLRAVYNFPSGLAEGVDGLRPQHLKDMLNHKDAEDSSLCIALTKLCNFMLSGKTPQDHRPLLFGANLIALRKKDGGVRPIAVGLVYRRLPAKVAVFKYGKKREEMFRPNQVSCGVRGGAEAVVHAARSYVDEKHDGIRVLFKVDFFNAFNTVRQDVVLRQVKDHFPKLYPFLWSSYSEPSILSCGDQNRLSSSSGIQQGDPLGPFMFCLATQPLVTSLESELGVWFLDDGVVAVHSRANGLQTIPLLNGDCDPLSYPLFFPLGTKGFPFRAEKRGRREEAGSSAPGGFTVNGLQTVESGLSCSQRITLYHAFVEPYMDCSSSVWSTLSLEEREKLKKRQDAAARVRLILDIP